MNNYISKYSRIKKEISEVSALYRREDEVLKFNTHLENKLENFNPTIMVYGVYNAGKSTLLNAIFGQDEMAKTGDSPETAEINAYSYNGYTIYDTPGINAPIEHQAVTDEHLAKSELIIFVLSNDGSFEDRYIYEKIGEIIKAKKPILIAMNNKSGIDMNSIEAKSEIDKVNQHLSTICDEMGIDKAEEKVSFTFVDAKTALEGKIEKEQELIDESKIKQFETIMNNLLGSSGKEEVTNALNLYIKDYITSTLTLIDEKIDNPEIKKTQELITYLEKLKQKTFVDLKDIVMQSTTIVTANLLELMLSKDKKSIEDMVTKTTEDINIKINQKIQEVQGELQTKAKQFATEFKQFSIEAPVVDLDIKTLTQAKQTQKSNNKAAFASAGTSLATMVPPTIIIPTPLGPLPVKPLLMIASALFVAFSGSDEARIKAEAKLDEKRAQHLSAKNKSDEYGMKLKETLIQRVNENLDNSFTGILKSYLEFSKELEIKNTELLEDKRKLQDILNDLYV